MTFLFLAVIHCVISLALKSFKCFCFCYCIYIFYCEWHSCLVLITAASQQVPVSIVNVLIFFSSWTKKHVAPFSSGQKVLRRPSHHLSQIRSSHLWMSQMSNHCRIFLTFGRLWCCCLTSGKSFILKSFLKLASCILW